MGPTSSESQVGIDIDLGKEDLDETPPYWENTLAEFLVGQRPFFPFVLESLTKAWKSKEKIEFSRIDSGFVLFKFRTPEKSQRVLEQGSWFV